MLSSELPEGKLTMKAIRHVGIVVKDLAKMLYFYRDVLGFQIQKEMSEAGEFIDSLTSLKGVKVKTVKMSAEDGNLIELLHFESHPRNLAKRDLNDCGYSHVAFTVENLDFEYNRLQEVGVAFNSAPRVSPDNYAKVAFCRDPEGNFIELVEVL
jgi:catechol 2,3-dioxygenase-like lactoylglutathione lyase family enzyme